MTTVTFGNKARKNAITTEWPKYLTRCQDTLLVNHRSSMSLQKDASDEFFTTNHKPTMKSARSVAMTTGLSAMSPYLAQNSIVHPLTSNFSDVRLLRSYSNAALSRETQQRIDDYYNPCLQAYVKNRL